MMRLLREIVMMLIRGPQTKTPRGRFATIALLEFLVTRNRDQFRADWAALRSRHQRLHKAETKTVEAVALLKVSEAESAASRATIEKLLARIASQEVRRAVTTESDSPELSLTDVLAAHSRVLKALSALEAAGGQALVDGSMLERVRRAVLTNRDLGAIESDQVALPNVAIGPIADKTRD